MELTFNDLKKRDVINIADGKCLGRVVDLRFSFPKGSLVGIYVPGRKGCGLFRLFDKTVIYIDESRIVKIGGDVILVNLKCTENCTDRINYPKEHCGEKKATQGGCCPPICPPPKPHEKPSNYGGNEVDFTILSGGVERIDTGDY